ncbi:MAG: hypothetical protein Barrevirus4_14 [Barrevirus sp.]|uniref:Uncharacterized protein n=1 Tax=Barrevirus sp. TaxID=2487763 RepID=A0A3G4ZPV8_9VIRU|nr:MAG: hypothetical protein Barrevirus4_14 [Barrevirus sp.]
MHPSVIFRLNVYNLYTKGSIIWTHPVLALNGIICKKPENINDITTFTFPHYKTGEIMRADTDEFFCYDGNKKKPNWGSLHSYIEGLAKEWTAVPYVINEEPDRININL